MRFNGYQDVVAWRKAQQEKLEAARDKAIEAYPSLAATIRQAAEKALDRQVRRPLLGGADGRVASVDGYAIKRRGDYLTCTCGDYFQNVTGKGGQLLCPHIIAFKLADVAGLAQKGLGNPTKHVPPVRHRAKTTLDMEKAAVNYEEQEAWRAYKYSFSGRRDYMMKIHANGEYVQPRIFPGDSEETIARVTALANELNAQLDEKRRRWEQTRKELAHA